MSAYPPPPPGTVYLAVVSPSVSNIMVGHTFMILMLPLLAGLFYFSTRHSRRQPIFVLNVIAILLSIIIGILIDYYSIRSMLDPSANLPVSINFAIGLLCTVNSIIVDSILLVRLLVVYPPSQMHMLRFVSIIALPVLLKVARIINFIVFTVVLGRASSDPVKLLNAWANAPYLKIEWVMQLVDNFYASTLFLLKLWARNQRHTRSVNGVGTAGSQGSFFFRQIRTLFYISVSNFVFPAIFSLAQLIIIFNEVNPTTVNLVILANISVAVIGVVFATVWAGSSQARQEREISHGSTTQFGSAGGPKGPSTSALAPGGTVGTIDIGDPRSSEAVSMYMSSQKAASEAPPYEASTPYAANSDIELERFVANHGPQEYQRYP